jgi:hypothetical protein
LVIPAIGARTTGGSNGRGTGRFSPDVRHT